MTDHPNLSPDINHNIRTSEAMGGWWISGLPQACMGPHDQIFQPRQIFKIQTRNTRYELKSDPTNSNWWLIRGHAQYCPKWTTCRIAGSTWGGSLLKIGYIGVGMHLEVSLYSAIDGLFETNLTTTPMQEVEVCSCEGSASQD